MKVDKNLEQLAKFQPLFSRKRFCAVPPPISISPLMYLLSQRRGRRVANERWKVVARSRRQKSWQWPTTSAHPYLFLLGPHFSISCENRKRNSLIGHVLKDTRSSLGHSSVWNHKGDSTYHCRKRQTRTEGTAYHVVFIYAPSMVLSWIYQTHVYMWT